MTQTGGLPVLYAWIIFGVLLATLAAIVIRRRP